jgi:phosphatidylserine/phosphatidylglycerophosphate/cardiolipin synthase-like enzyme
MPMRHEFDERTPRRLHLSVAPAMSREPHWKVTYAHSQSRSTARRLRKPIAAALMEAKRRGVDVRAVLDRSQRTERYSGASFLANAGIPVVIDEKPAIAHNKVLVIDAVTTITGSFNFTRAAQKHNAENVFVIRGDREIARRYADNWQSRARVSVPYSRQ